MLESLDVEAWDRWVAYRKAIRKPIKPASEPAMKLKLQRYGADQGAVVDQSISNQWQGLFDLKKSKPAFGEKPVKTEKQMAADAEALSWANSQSERYWNSLEPNPYNRLKLCDALWARYTIDPDSHLAERLEWLKDVTAIHLRDVDAKLVVGDPSLMAMVWCFFGERGAKRIKARAAETV
jgi:hypothetical protein